MTLNKVVTAQYFVWYLCLLPLALPALAAQTAVPAAALVGGGAVWVAAQLHWLGWAYQLEMKVGQLVAGRRRRRGRQAWEMILDDTQAECCGDGQGGTGTGERAGGRKAWLKDEVGVWGRGTVRMWARERA